MGLRLSNSWQLAKASASVLRADKELLVFPIVSGIAALMVTASFFIPAYATGFSDQIFGINQDRTALGYAVLFAFYFVQYLVIFYFNTALVGAALMRFKGGDPTVSDGFALANDHLTHILGYAAVSATVGVILRLLADKGGQAGQVVSRFGGMGWTIATYLVVPVLVVEGRSPMAAVKRSTQLLKDTWGEQLVGGAGMGFVFGLAIFGAILLGSLGVAAAASTQSVGLMLAAVVVFVVMVIGVGLVQGALSGIYTAAVYRYATGNDVSDFYPPQLISSAFQQKQIKAR